MGWVCEKMFWRVLVLAVVVQPWLCSRSAADSPSLPPIKPKICEAFFPGPRVWGPTVFTEGRPDCPPGHAMVAELRPSAYRIAPGLTESAGWCCPLPDDVLTNEDTFALAECPPDHVVTGVRLTRLDGSLAEVPISPQGNALMDGPRYLRCTKINTTRYQLGEPTVARLVADDGPPPLYSRLIPYPGKDVFPVVLTQTRIPTALRFGLGRIHVRAWERTFCVGYPWGSLYVGAPLERGCPFIHRQLQFRGLVGDPPAGSEVRYFPDCVAVTNPTTDTPGCLPPISPGGEK